MQKTGISYPRQELNAFEYQNVELLDETLKGQRDRALCFIMEIPTDDLMRGFRVRAGLNSWEDVPGTSLDGWYEDHMFNGSTLGQWLSALSKYYLQTKRDDVFNKLTEILDEFEKTIGADGYFYYREEKGENVWHYMYDKMVLGLTDAYVFAGIEKSRDLLSRITDWAILHLSRRRVQPTRQNFVGVFSHEAYDNEWYTLSENLYRAYLATGEDKYREFAKEWAYDTFWDAIRLKQASYWPGLHAYSHVNSLGGAALSYMVTGDRHYYETIENFYNVFEQYEFFAGGGYGPGECLVGDTRRLATMMRAYKWTYEIPCSTWAGFKLGRYLINLTGQSRFGDWLEKQLYNNILAASDMRNSDKRGETFYYGCFAQRGATKFMFHEGWPCCSGTYPLCLTDYVNLLYFYTEDSLYSNLFVSSRVEHVFHGKKVTLTQTSGFPNAWSTRYDIATDGTAEFDFRIRVPRWVKGRVKVLVNGRDLGADQDSAQWGIASMPGSWMCIGGVWNDGDVVEIQMEAELTFVPCDDTDGDFGTFMYGPIVLVAKGVVNGDISVDGRPLAEVFKRRSEDSLVFDVKDNLGRTFTFMPYYDIEQGESLSMYLERTHYL